VGHRTSAINEGQPGLRHGPGPRRHRGRADAVAPEFVSHGNHSKLLKFKNYPGSVATGAG